MPAHKIIHAILVKDWQIHVELIIITLFYVMSLLIKLLLEINYLQEVLEFWLKMLENKFPFINNLFILILYFIYFQIILRVKKFNSYFNYHYRHCSISLLNSLNVFLF